MYQIKLSFNMLGAEVAFLELYVNKNGELKLQITDNIEPQKNYRLGTVSNELLGEGA